MATPKPSLVVTPADIGRHWGIDLGASFEPLEPESAHVVRSGAYVIREAETSAESVQWEHDLVGFLAPRVPEIVAPLRAVDGSTFLIVGNHVVSVMPYIAAGPANRSDPLVRREVPRLLARLHRAASEWPGARPRPGRSSWRELDWVANDTWDWIAAAVTVLSLQGDGTIDRQIADETMAAYVDAGGRDESYALDPLMRQFLLAVALHVRTRKATGASWSSQFQGMIEAALERFV